MKSTDLLWIGLGLFLLKKKSTAAVGKIEDYNNQVYGRIDRHWDIYPGINRNYARISKLTEVHKDTERAVKTFNLGGIEFGNYMSQQDRANFLAATVQSLYDLARCLNISPSKIGLEGQLYIALGARGRGGGAMGHFEPGFTVINLTKNNGMTSVLAHEYGHFLDYYAGKNRFASGDSFSKGRIYDFTGKLSWHKKLLTLFDDAMYNVYWNDEGMPTNYQKINVKRSKYFRSRPEIFARLFQAYILERLKTLKIHNPFLQSSRYESSMPKYIDASRSFWAMRKIIRMIY